MIFVLLPVITRYLDAHHGHLQSVSPGPQKYLQPGGIGRRCALSIHVPMVTATTKATHSQNSHRR